MTQTEKNIGARPLGLRLAQTRKSRILTATAIILAISAFGAAGVAPIAPDAANLPVRTITETLELPSLAEQIESLSSTPQLYVAEEAVRPGDTLATLLSRLGVDDQAAANFIKSDSTARTLLQVRPGKRVQAQVDEDGELQWLTATLPAGADNTVKTLEIRRDGDHFRAIDRAARIERRLEMKAGRIQHSLFGSTDALGIPDSVTMQIVDMFSTDIDFASDLQPGDRFNVVYETLWQDGEYLRPGRVLAAEFVNAGRRLQTVWFDDPSSKQGGGYYSFDGKSMKKAFLKSPLEFSRISSGFAMRIHPISGQWKAHRGVDYAATTGTPIRAAADGTIDFAGSQNGYGNVVVIKHWNGYSTAYAHMSRFASGARRGAKVSQGQVIGYVGSTGWATGPHLHYEFRVNNEPRNPLTVNVPNPAPLAASDMPRFRTLTAEMTHRFRLLNPPTGGVQVAAR